MATGSKVQQLVLQARAAFVRSKNEKTFDDEIRKLKELVSSVCLKLERESNISPFLRV